MNWYTFLSNFCYVIDVCPRLSLISLNICNFSIILITISYEQLLILSTSVNKSNKSAAFNFIFTFIVYYHLYFVIGFNQIIPVTNWIKMILYFNPIRFAWIFALYCNSRTFCNAKFLHCSLSDLCSNWAALRAWLILLKWKIMIFVMRFAS